MASSAKAPISKTSIRSLSTCRSCASVATMWLSAACCRIRLASAAPTRRSSSSDWMRDSMLMDGKRGLVMGVANDHSIAWGIAKTLAAHGASLAFTYQGDALIRRVKPLAQSVGADLVLPCDVEDLASVDAAFAALKDKWGGIDFVVHAIAYTDKNELKGRYADTSRENFIRTMVISCFSF